MKVDELADAKQLNIDTKDRLTKAGERLTKAEEKCQQLKKMLKDLQKQYIGVTEELKSLKSNVDSGKEDSPNPKVNRNSSCDPNHPNLTYPITQSNV